MQRLSPKWLKNIPAKICVLAIVACPLFVWAQTDIDKARSAAQSGAASVYEQADRARPSLSMPQGLSHPPKPRMKTIDQSQSFSAQLSCPYDKVCGYPGAAGEYGRFGNGDGHAGYQSRWANGLSV